MKAREEYTVYSVYVENLLLNTYEYGDHELPAGIPTVPDYNAYVRGAISRHLCTACSPDGEAGHG
ncbi:hypothetical protein PHMEG_00031789 [Phytophthora megakarya]|uniref:Uncharacterized protein n=1 Tax=Phytophthora megakarya TaxID=4795 RepID=A0A225UXY4_9STRA|nr:hypothetical protein PHMEG_00031789 [Phytophthora megakarya]